MEGCASEAVIHVLRPDRGLLGARLRTLSMLGKGIDGTMLHESNSKALWPKRQMVEVVLGMRSRQRERDTKN